MPILRKRPKTHSERKRMMAGFSGGKKAKPTGRGRRFAKRVAGPLLEKRNFRIDVLGPLKKRFEGLSLVEKACFSNCLSAMLISSGKADIDEVMQKEIERYLPGRQKKLIDKGKIKRLLIDAVKLPPEYLPDFG